MCIILAKIKEPEGLCLNFIKISTIQKAINQFRQAPSFRDKMWPFQADISCSVWEESDNFKLSQKGYTVEAKWRSSHSVDDHDMSPKEVTFKWRPRVWRWALLA